MGSSRRARALASLPLVLASVPPPRGKAELLPVREPATPRATALRPAPALAARSPSAKPHSAPPAKPKWRAAREGHGPEGPPDGVAVLRATYLQLAFVCVYRAKSVDPVEPKELYATALDAARDERSAVDTQAVHCPGTIEVRRGGLKVLMALVAVVPDLFGSHLPPASGVQLVRALRAIENRL